MTDNISKKTPFVFQITPPTRYASIRLC